MCRIMYWTNWRVRCILRCSLFTKMKQTSRHLPNGRLSASLKLHRQRGTISRTGYRPSCIHSLCTLLSRIRYAYFILIRFHQKNSVYLFPVCFRRKAIIRTRPRWERRSDFSLLVRPMRFERTAFGVGVQRSIQLSYGRGYRKYYTISPAFCKAPSAGFFFFGCRITIHVGQVNKKDEG